MGEELSVVCFVFREFSHAHLAQMKYILPKSVCIDKVLVQIQCWLGIVMLIGLEVQMTEKALLVDASIWATTLFHGSARSRTVCPYLQQKPSILQQEAAVHS